MALRINLDLTAEGSDDGSVKYDRCDIITCHGHIVSNQDFNPLLSVVAEQTGGRLAQECSPRRPPLRILHSSTSRFALSLSTLFFE